MIESEIDAWVAQFRLTGSLIPEAFEPLNGVEWAPEFFPNIAVWVNDCPATPPLLMGRIRVNDPTSVDERSWGGTKALYR